MSQGVCRTLPNILLRKIHERFPDDIPEPADDELIFDAFDECEKVVCWTNMNVVQGDFARIEDGEYAGMKGYVTGFKGLSNVIVSLIEEETDGESDDSRRFSYKQIEVPEQSILHPRYVGGCTCVAIIRNMKTNECRIAVSGDSRCLIYMPGATVVDNCLIPVYGEKIDGREETPCAFLTPQHNVFNMEETSRLNEEYHGEFAIQGAFLVNPVTNFAIQPTRGFGDHDMYGTGYTHVPEITGTFFLEENAFLFAASDGVFDEKVWSDAEIVTRIAELYLSGLKANDIAKMMYDETLDRSLDGGYVDDISIFTYQIPEAQQQQAETREAAISVVEEAPSPARTSSKRSVPNMRKRRETLRRGQNQLPDLIDSLAGEEGTSQEVADKLKRTLSKNDEVMKEPESVLLTGLNERKEVEAGVKKGKKKKVLFTLKKFTRKENSNWQSKSVNKMS